MHSGAWFAALSSLLLLIGGAGEVFASELSWALKLEVGSEYDSNVFRLEKPEGESVDIESSPLARLGTRTKIAWKPSRAQQLDLRGFAGTKIFTRDEAQSENVAVLSLGANYSHSFPGRSMVFGLHGRHYDAENYDVFGEGRPVPGRTFSLSGLESSFALLGNPGHRASLGVGYRWFAYKPDADFDWAGPTAFANYRGNVWLGDEEVDEPASIDLSVAYRIDRRTYDGLAFRNQCSEEELLEPRCSVPTGAGRVDLMHVAAAEVAYTGERIYSLRYRAQFNDSNSFTQSFVRNRVDLGVTTELLAEIFVTARATVQFNVFLDSLLIAQDVNSQTFVSIDDENRNTLSLVFSREMSESLSLEGRYVIYSNEFATQELDFRRQTAYLGAVYSTGS